MGERGVFQPAAVRIFRNAPGAWLNIAALAYTLAGWALGVVLLAADSWYANAAGVLLTGHALIYSAYFVHELAHPSVFASAQANHRWGVLMSWINARRYAPFEALRRKHMRHPGERAHAFTLAFKRGLNAS